MATYAFGTVHGLRSAREELVALLRQSESRARSHPGCRHYEFSVAVADPDRYVLVGVWQDRAAFDAFHASDDFRTYQMVVRPLLAASTELAVHESVDETRPVRSAAFDPRDAD